jgi:hypothetical protein
MIQILELAKVFLPMDGKAKPTSVDKPNQK